MMMPSSVTRIVLCASVVGVFATAGCGGESTGTERGLQETPAAAVVGSAAMAESDFPSKPITYILPYAAGGTTDLGARALAKIAEADLGQPITVVNTPGAAGSVGLAQLARSVPDGYTIGTFNAITTGIEPHMRKVPFAPLNDFSPIVIYGGYNSFVAVSNDKPWRSLAEVIDFAKQNPGVLTVGVSGIGSSTHLGVARLMSENKATVTFVPFGGGAPTVSAMLGGHIDVAAVSSEVVPHVKAGKARLLTVLQNTTLAQFPDLENIRELGYDWDVNSWVGVAGPEGMDPDALETLRNAFLKAAETDEFKQRMADLALAHYAVGPEESAKWVKQSHAEFGQVVKDLQIGLYAK
jgi:tripartite-type tricarboxylate transporter receptor subunit TctC